MARFSARSQQWRSVAKNAVIAKNSTFARKFRNAFLTGLLIFLPLGTTVFVLNFLLGLFQEPATDLAYELGIKEESFFFGLETLLAIVGLLFGVLGVGGKREKGKEKEGEKRRTKRHEKVFRLHQSPFFFCVLLPHFTISRAPFSFLFSIKENKSERVHRKTARARTHTHSHAHAPHALSQKPPFHFLWKSSSHPSVRLNANEIFLSVFVLFCMCVCGASSTFSSFVSREKGKRDG